MEDICKSENDGLTPEDEYNMDYSLYMKHRDPPIGFEDWWKTREPQAPAAASSEPDISQIIEDYRKQGDS